MSEVVVEKLSKDELINEINNLDDYEFFELIGRFFLANIEVGKRALIQMIKESNYR